MSNGTVFVNTFVGPGNSLGVGLFVSEGRTTSLMTGMRWSPSTARRNATKRRRWLRHNGWLTEKKARTGKATWKVLTNQARRLPPYKGKVFSPIGPPYSDYSATPTHRSVFFSLSHTTSRHIRHGLDSILVMCFLTTHIGYQYSQGPVIVLSYHLGQTTHFVSYLHSTPICLTHSHSLILIHLSHNDAFPLFFLSHAS
jgi:hypothetical protein